MSPVWQATPSGGDAMRIRDSIAKPEPVAFADWEFWRDSDLALGVLHVAIARTFGRRRPRQEDDCEAMASSYVSMPSSVPMSTFLPIAFSMISSRRRLRCW